MNKKFDELKLKIYIKPLKAEKKLYAYNIIFSFEKTKTFLLDLYVLEENKL